MPLAGHPPEVLVDGELTVRRFGVEDTKDAERLHAAIVASVEHLRPFMPWAAYEPLPLADRVELLQRWAEEWDDATSFGYGMFVGDEVVGGCGLHPRIGPGGIEIGYWVRVDQAGRGLATRAARLLTDAAFTIDGIDHVEIHHDNANVRSGRVPAKLGYVARREVEDGISAPGDCGVSTEWRMERAAWTATAAGPGGQEAGRGRATPRNRTGRSASSSS